jgi:hypothetical protein
VANAATGRCTELLLAGGRVGRRILLDFDGLPFNQYNELTFNKRANEIAPTLSRVGRSSLLTGCIKNYRLDKLSTNLVQIQQLSSLAEIFHELVRMKQ